jgi:hypothetical protein
MTEFMTVAIVLIVIGAYSVLMDRLSKGFDFDSDEAEHYKA